MIHLKNPGDLILVSPLDFHGYVMDLPPLKTEHVEGAVRFSLRTMHPGDPADTCIDYWMHKSLSRSFAHSGGRVVAFAVNNVILETYRKESIPLIPGIALLSQAAISAGSGMKLGILVGSTWIEIALFQDTVLLTTAAVDPAKDCNWIRHLSRLENFPDRDALTVFIVVAVKNSEIEHDLSERLKDVGKEAPLVIDMQKILNSLSPVEDEIFSKKQKKNKASRTRIISALLILNLFAGGTSLYRSADKAENRLAFIKKEYEARKNYATEVEKVSAEIRTLETTGAIFSTTKRDTPYTVISVITSNLHSGWIRSLVIRDDSFQVEAEGADALDVFDSLEATGVFKDVSLHQASPSPIRGELFSISGYLRNDTK